MLFFQHKIFKNTLFQIIARFFSSGSSFIITIIVARHFDILGYGDFAKVTAFVTLFYLLADFGFNAIFLQKEDSRLHFRDLFYSRILISIATIVLLNSLSYILPYNAVTNSGFSPEVRFGILIFSFNVITESILFTASAVFQRELTYELFMISSIVGGVVGVVFVTFFTWFSYPLSYIYLAFIISGVAESFTALVLTEETIFPIRVDHVFMRRLARETFPLTLLLIFNLIYFRIDMILLSILKTTKDVAMYDLAYKVFDFLIALPLFLSNALYPQILQDVKNLRTIPLAKRYVVLFVVSSFLVVVPIWIIAPYLSLIKKEFIEAAIPLRLLLLSLPIFFGTNILQWLLIAMRKQRFLAFVYFFSTVFNIALNVIFIPQYGYFASAIITGVSELIVFVVLWMKLFNGKKEA